MVPLGISSAAVDSSIACISDCNFWIQTPYLLGPGMTHTCMAVFLPGAQTVPGRHAGHHPWISGILAYLR